jgi:hypothetical protein
MSGLDAARMKISHLLNSLLPKSAQLHQRSMQDITQYFMQNDSHRKRKLRCPSVFPELFHLLFMRKPSKFIVLPAVAEIQ